MHDCLVYCIAEALWTLVGATRFIVGWSGLAKQPYLLSLPYYQVLLYIWFNTSCAKQCYDLSPWASVSVRGTHKPLHRILPLPRILEARTIGPVTRPLTARAYLVRTSLTLGGSVPVVCTCPVLHL